MASLDLHYVDELIAARHTLHGGLPGAPIVEGGHRQGASINRSCVVMLSALLQDHIQQVFLEAAKKRFPELAASDAGLDQYWRQMKMWGNPSDENVDHLFLKIGIVDVFHDLAWQKADSAYIRRKLRDLNTLRNQIAHGVRHLTVNHKKYSLSLGEIYSFRNFTECFGGRFENHVMSKI